MPIFMDGADRQWTLPVVSQGGPQSGTGIEDPKTPFQCEQKLQDLIPARRIDVEIVVAVIRGMKVEEDAADLIDLTDVTAERGDLVLVAAVDGEVDEKRWMGGALDVAQDLVKGGPSQEVMGLSQSIDAHEDGVRRGLQGKRPVGIDDDRVEAGPVGVFHDMLDSVSPITPEKRLATLEIEAAAAPFVERVDDLLDLTEAHVVVATGGNPAVAASQDAAIRQDEAADEGIVPSEEVVAEHIQEPIEDGLHGWRPSSS
jgi:hypothetical protein